MPTARATRSTATTRRREILRSAAPRWVLRLTGHLQDGGIRTPPSPPTCPRGWQTGPPDFVGVGVQRGGTTRWFDLIASHPEVSQPSVAKELHYFDRFYGGGCTPADLAGYRDYFPRDGTCKVGEWTPIYMSAPWIPRLLAAAAPDTRLLVLARDPVERYISGLEHNARIAKECATPLSQLAPMEAFARGLYHSQLVRLLTHFPRSQVLVLQYERCVKEPRSELRRTFEFLGLRDTDFVPDIDAHPNAGQSKKPTLDHNIRDAYVTAYTDEVVRLIDSFPEIDVRLWPNFSHLTA
jgi:hypothetical protein